MWFPEDLGDTPFKGCLNFLLHLFHPNNAIAALFLATLLLKTKENTSVHVQSA